MIEINFCVCLLRKNNSIYLLINIYNKRIYLLKQQQNPNAVKSICYLTDVDIATRSMLLTFYYRLYFLHFIAKVFIMLIYTHTHTHYI